MKQAALTGISPFQFIPLKNTLQNFATKGPSVTTIRFTGSQLTPQALAKYIDHTKLTYKPGENPEEAIKALCQEARENNFYAVCVRPDIVSIAKQALKGTDVKVATVIGFPSKKTKLLDEKALVTIGDVPQQQKLREAEQAIKDGADELDLVMNVHQFLLEASQAFPVATYTEFKNIKAIAGQKPVKVIIETDLLTPDEIRKATLACIKAGVDMVKTSTGMLEGGIGATVDNIRLIRQTLADAGVEGKVGIKASGGIRTAQDAIALIEAGATRLGTSQGVAIVQDQQGQQGY